MKGPTFADELIRRTPSAFTIASDNKEIFKVFEEITSSTNIILDFT
jgi:glycerol-3-phosphate dehydrogenase